MSDNTSNVTIHVGSQSDEGTMGTNGIDVVDFAGGDDTGGGGRNYNNIHGGSGADTLISQGVWDDVFGGSGNDNIVLQGHGAWAFGGTGDDTIIGSDNTFLTERLYGGEGDDTIDGGGGRDYIFGGAGDDDLTGGSGADVFFFSEGHGNDTIQDFNAAEGDRIYLRSFDKTITWEQLQSKITTVEDPDNSGTVTGVQIDLSDWGGGTITLNGITSVSDLTEDMFYLDNITGDIGGDHLWGGTSDDTMTGGGGADTFMFWEGHGNDTITDFNIADDKIDLTWFDNAITWSDLQAAMRDENGSTVIDLSQWGGGTITLQNVPFSQLTAAMFNLHPLVGSDGVDDTIYSEAGDDTMTGGTGADTFVIGEGDGNDTITDFSTAEGDTIDLSTFYQGITWEELQAAMTDRVDDPETDVNETAVVINLSQWGGGTVTLQGVTSFDLTAEMFDLPDGSGGRYRYDSESDNTIEGTRGHDVLYGGEGNDTLRGQQGRDWLFGQEGDDTLEGGEGNDVLMGGEGNDTLEGGAGDDLMVGGAGNDTMTGGADADTFVFHDDHGNDRITDFNASEGDKIDLTTLRYALTWDQLRATFSTVAEDSQNPGAVTGVKIDLSEYGGGTIILEGVIDPSTLTEEMFDLYKLTGGDGDDTLQGGTSDDTLTGGGGADTFVFSGLNSGADTIADFDAGQGDRIDLTAFEASLTWQDVQAATTDMGGSAVIDLSAWGGGTITVTGVDPADLTAEMFVLDDFVGTDGDDIIEGTAADNRLTGGEGADTFVFGPGHGNDTITDFTGGTDNIDLSAFTGITSVDDLVYWQDGNDTVIFTGHHGGGTIVLQNVSPGDLSPSDFTFYQDEYTGTAGAETLTGGAGDDTVTGLGGDDTLTGGAGADTFVFEAGHGDDTVTDFTDGEDLIDLSAFTGITQFSDLMVNQVGNNVQIDLSGETGGGTITLQNVLLADLDETDFIFYETPSDGG